MSDSRSVAGTVLCKIGSLTMVSRDKNTDEDAHEMTDHSVRKNLHKFNCLNWLYINVE